MTRSIAIEPSTGPQAALDERASKAAAAALMGQLGGGRGRTHCWSPRGHEPRRRQAEEGEHDVVKTLFKAEEGAVKAGAAAEGDDAKSKDARKALS